jgi:hypothetical protein
MASAVAAHEQVAAIAARVHIAWDSLLAWLLPFSLVPYLGLRGGGYDQVINGQVGVAVWWLIFVVAVFRLSVVRTSRAGWIWLAVLCGYAAWTTTSLLWTQSAENTMINVSLVSLYGGVALLAMSIGGRKPARHILYGLGSAIVVVTVVALLSRLRFEWFTASQTTEFLQDAAHKLSYPLNYWNALAAFAAIGIPLMLYAATGARSLLARALGGAAVPPLVLCVFLTDSRGGAIEVVIGVVLFLLLAPDRLAKLMVIVACGAGAALVVAAANQRTALRAAERTALAAQQGNELLAITIAVAVAVGLLVAALTLLERHALDVPLPSRQRTTGLSGAALLACVVVFVVAGGPGGASRAWNQFKTPAGPSRLSGATALQRLQNVTGNGRYQYWQTAVKAGDLRPLTGTGAGTFVYWWAQHGTLSGGYVRDAHSLYIQALAELGYPGLVLIAGVVAWILVGGVIRVIRGRDPAQRLAIAAATAGAAVFAFSASVEWIWLIPVLPIATMMLAVVVFSPGPGEPSTQPTLRKPGVRVGAQVAAAAAALAVIVAVALPMSATGAIRESQSLAQRGKIRQALAQAVDAVNLQPYAAAPWVQEALVLEQAGDLPDALSAARHATDHEATNWQTWFVLCRVEARTGHVHAAIADYLKARSLDPRSPLFNA